MIFVRVSNEEALVRAVYWISPMAAASAGGTMGKVPRTGRRAAIA